MHIREKVAAVSMSNNTQRYVVDVLDLKEYLQELYESKLDPGYIALKMRAEVNEVLFDINQTLRSASRSESSSHDPPHQKREVVPKQTPKPQLEEEPEQEARKSPQLPDIKARIPKQQTKDDQGGLDYSEEDMEYSEDNSAAEDAEVSRLKKLEEDLFG